MFAGPKGFSNTEKGEPETNLLVKHLPPNDGSVYHLTFAQSDWMIEAGIASRMKHMGSSYALMISGHSHSAATMSVRSFPV